LSLENRTNFLELRAEALDLLEQSKREGVNVAQLFDDKHSPFRSLIETCLEYSNIALKSIDLAMALLFVLGDENSPGLIMELNFPESEKTEGKGDPLPEGCILKWLTGLFCCHIQMVILQKQIGSQKKPPGMKSLKL
jgi:hypothetical protein